jgi:hypothetical protein
MTLDQGFPNPPRISGIVLHQQDFNWADVSIDSHL